MPEFREGKIRGENQMVWNTVLPNELNEIDYFAGCPIE